eukprot:1176546-Prorocentrum_minimum.AAC.1
MSVLLFALFICWFLPPGAGQPAAPAVQRRLGAALLAGAAGQVGDQPGQHLPRGGPIGSERAGVLRRGAAQQRPRRHLAGEGALPAVGSNPLEPQSNGPGPSRPVWPGRNGRTKRTP